MTDKNRSRLNRIKSAVLVLLIIGSFCLVTAEVTESLSNRGGVKRVIDTTSPAPGHMERDDGGYFTLVDESGGALYLTARQVCRGDEFIAEDDSHYRVDRVEGDLARCTLIAGDTTGMNTSPGLLIPTTTDGGVGKPVVGIYNTHDDESYIPSQGTAAMVADKDSGVELVSLELTDKLNSLGINTVYDDTSHYPHDAGAYSRSRRTAFGLMKRGVICLIDLHRNAAPKSSYFTKIDKRGVARITLVVGKWNSQKSSTLGFAREIKHHLDGIYPGLVKGIYIAEGGFNQDLLPTSLLLEVGSQNNTLEEALAGASLFGDVMPRVFEVSPITGVTRLRTGADQGGSWRALAGILAALVIGSFGYLLISTGSWQGAVKRIREFSGRELADLLGRVPGNYIALKEELKRRGGDGYVYLQGKTAGGLSVLRERMATGINELMDLTGRVSKNLYTLWIEKFKKNRI